MDRMFPGDELQRGGKWRDTKDKIGNKNGPLFTQFLNDFGQKKSRLYTFYLKDSNDFIIEKIPAEYDQISLVYFNVILWLGF